MQSHTLRKEKNKLNILNIITKQGIEPDILNQLEEEHEKTGIEAGNKRVLLLNEELKYISPFIKAKGSKGPAPKYNFLFSCMLSDR